MDAQYTYIPEGLQLFIKNKIPFCSQECSLLQNDYLTVDCFRKSLDMLKQWIWKLSSLLHIFFLLIADCWVSEYYLFFKIVMNSLLHNILIWIKIHAFLWAIEIKAITINWETARYTYGQIRSAKKKKFLISSIIRRLVQSIKQCLKKIVFQFYDFIEMLR